MLIWRTDWGVQTEAETVTEQTEAEAKPQQQAKPKKTDSAQTVRPVFYEIGALPAVGADLILFSF